MDVQSNGAHPTQVKAPPAALSDTRMAMAVSSLELDVWPQVVAVRVLGCIDALTSSLRARKAARGKRSQ